jgi:uncharacterized protein DUF3145
VTTRGVVYIHATPTALCPHIEWAVGGVLGARVSLEWTGQPAAPGTVRAELSWQGEPGAAASIASALRDWRLIRFEVTEEPSAGAEGERYAWTPDLGLFSATIGVHGDILVREDRLRSALARSSSDPGVTVEEEIAGLLGAPWDEELEPFRYAGDGAPVRWLHQVV